MPHTILIVDDNDAHRGMLKTVLEMRGYQVLVARSGAAGLQHAAEQAIDAALVDVEMPEMDGFEFCRLLREQTKSGARPVPVWIMTGTLRLGLNKRAAAVGALVVLRKPLSVEDTCEQFEREFRQQTAPSAPAAGDTGGAPPPAHN